MDHDESLSPDYSHSHSATPPPIATSPKRKVGPVNINANGRPVKRRASKACASCRQRKVRCNVVEGGVPCTNCRLDDVPCVVTESKRRKKLNCTAKPLDAIHEFPHHHHHDHVAVHDLTTSEAFVNGSVNPSDITNPAYRRTSGSTTSGHDGDDLDSVAHVPHSLYRNQSHRLSDVDNQRPLPFANRFDVTDGLLSSASLHGDLVASRMRTTPPTNGPRTPGLLPPPFIKALPPRIMSDEIQYLYKKGALTIPDTTFRNALLSSYVEFVHPYMPLIDVHELLHRIDANGAAGKVSLIVFQAVMFAGTAFVDMEYLTRAGFPTRKAARKAFYLKTRLLYDFDYEGDRVCLVQALLLMTYWYETPDDQKDTWHWMGVAISLAHTIGLHRNSDKSNMDPRRKRLWKRIWWSCFMRDRLVALGMRRPTRIKDEDFDVPKLTLDDFELQALSSENSTISHDCKMIRDVQMQKELAMMCIAKAELCLCVSHVLQAQYSVLVRQEAQSNEGYTRASVMLIPKKLDQTDEVRRCDIELAKWRDALPEQFIYTAPTETDATRGAATICVQKALLHMVYFATVSALHRPQVLPSAETAILQKCRDLQDVSRQKVREASREITRMARDLQSFGYEKFLPTTGVTVLLPAIIIHLLDIKSYSDETRTAALEGFCQCMTVLENLRDNYAAADFATQFLEAAIRKADIKIGSDRRTKKTGVLAPGEGFAADGIDQSHVAQNVGQLLDAGRAARLTPPPEQDPVTSAFNFEHSTFPPMHALDPAATSPPESDTSPQPPADPMLSSLSLHNSGFQSDDKTPGHVQFPSTSGNIATTTNSGQPATHLSDAEFAAMINFDEELDADWNATNGHDTNEELSLSGLGVHGESGAFLVDMDWMKDGAEGGGGWSLS